MMTLNDDLILAGALVAGLFLGGIFFGGLWWTVQKGVSSEQPVIWFFISLMLRMSIVLVGFYLVGHGQWQRLIACLLGFICARFIVTALTATFDKHRNPTTKEIGHAS